MLTFQWTGVEQVTSKLRELSPAIRQELAAELFQQAEQVMADSKEHYVPVDTGRLRATGFVRPPDVDGHEISVRLGFGTDYAIYVHENLSARHPVGEAKFLERPLLAAVSRITAAIAAAVKRGVR